MIRIKDLLMFEKDEKALHYKCMNCGELGHFEFFCPKLVFAPKKDEYEYYVQYYMMAKKIFQRCFKRPKRDRFCCMKKSWNVKFAAFEICNNYTKIIAEIIEDCYFLDFEENVYAKNDI